MSTAYDPDGNRETVLALARRFFRDNPDEMLTRMDMQVKFSCGPDMASLVARQLIQEGTVTRDQLPRPPSKPRSSPRRLESFPHNLTRGMVVTLEAYIRHGNLAKAARATGRNYTTMCDHMKDARRLADVHTTAELAIRYVREVHGAVAADVDTAPATA